MACLCPMQWVTGYLGMQTSLNEKARGPSSLLTLITPTGWCPSSLANIIRYYKSNFTMVRRWYIELVNWDYKPFATGWGHHLLDWLASNFEFHGPWWPGFCWIHHFGVSDDSRKGAAADLVVRFVFIGWPLDIPFTARRYLAIKMNQACNHVEDGITASMTQNSFRELWVMWLLYASFKGPSGSSSCRSSTLEARDTKEFRTGKRSLHVLSAVATTFTGRLSSGRSYLRCGP